MPKSKNRRKHKQKANARKIRIRARNRQEQKMLQEIQRIGQEQYFNQMKEKAEQEKVDGVEELEIEDEIHEDIDIDIVEEENKSSE